ncbi:MAG TPA: putative glycolipid-binding domain-containing protein [Thermoanaerobaculia bacterium]|nr:putative glycolipid-binding domain-containing protein [Thermoanaerobaculia bacterium]
MTLLWRRLDEPGMEACRIVRYGDCWRLEGAAVFANDGVACRADYVVVCDDAWRSLSADVSGWIGNESFDVQLLRDGAGRWLRNGVEHRELDGCIDVDLNFSPSTNTLPIRRLGLAIGASAEVSAAWLRFPSLKLERLEQTYTRLSENGYRYSSAGGSFVAELEVDDEGLMTRYGDFWARV